MAASTLVAFDTETFPISDEHVAPPIVCLSYALRVDGEIKSGISSIAEREALLELVTDLLTNPDYIIVGHNAAFDLAVIGKAFPDLWPAIFAVVAEGRVRCTKLWEKEWRVSTSGDLEYERLPDGTNHRLEYKLASLETRYLGIDRSADKGADSWRLHYQMLVDRPISRWPTEAVGYALDDAIGTLRVHEKQLEVSTEEGPGSTNSHDTDVAADLGLFLMTDKGMATDPVRWHEMKEWLLEELSPENMSHLIGAGILRDAEPARPKGKAKVVWTDPVDCIWEQLIENVESETSIPAAHTKTGKLSLSLKSRNDYWQQLAEIKPDPAACPWYVYFNALRIEQHSGAMTKPKKESIAQKKLREMVGQLCEAQEIEPVLSAVTKEPSLSIDAIEQLAAFSPVIDEYVKRMRVNKLVTTELPRMCYRDDKGDPIDGAVAPVVRFNFDCVKETFRTSSYAGDLFASANGQNVDPRARGMYVAREGHVLCSVDYSALELCALADRLEELFGNSVLGNLIRSGVDPHAYLGSQLAFTLDEGFRSEVQAQDVTQAMQIYEIFLRAKAHESEDVRGFFKHYRTFAKPTGLGYPGMLGPKTFISYAWNNYRIRIDLNTATMLREVWFQTFPEMRPYFDWIKTSCRDPRNDTIGFRESDNSPIQGFCYTAAGGAFRAGCPITACANGAGLQSNAALGAKLAVFNVQRACYDPTQRSVLFGSYGVNFIHDEIIVEMPKDDFVHERAMAISTIMKSSMLLAIPRVPVGTEASLMDRWDKYAEPVYDTNDRLTLWSPPDDQ